MGDKSLAMSPESTQENQKSPPPLLIKTSTAAEYDARLCLGSTSLINAPTSGLSILFILRILREGAKEEKGKLSPVVGISGV